MCVRLWARVCSCACAREAVHVSVYACACACGRGRACVCVCRCGPAYLRFVCACMRTSLHASMINHYNII